MMTKIPRIAVMPLLLVAANSGCSDDGGGGGEGVDGGATLDGQDGDGTSGLIDVSDDSATEPDMSADTGEEDVRRTFFDLGNTTGRDTREDDAAAPETDASGPPDSTSTLDGESDDVVDAEDADGRDEEADGSGSGPREDASDTYSDVDDESSYLGRGDPFAACMGDEFAALIAPYRTAGEFRVSTISESSQAHACAEMIECDWPVDAESDCSAYLSARYDEYMEDGCEYLLPGVTPEALAACLSAQSVYDDCVAQRLECSEEFGLEFGDLTECEEIYFDSACECGIFTYPDYDWVCEHRERYYYEYDYGD